MREGVYVLPDSPAALFDTLRTEVRTHGRQASLRELSTRDALHRAAVLAVFDRSRAGRKWRMEAQSLAAALPAPELTKARRRWRGTAEALQTSQPAAQAPLGVRRLDIRKFRGKRWATRARPWVGRLACAWLIRRFIDPEARFVWLADRAGSTPAPRGPLGLDYNGERFTHVSSRASVEVLATSFGLKADLRLQKIVRAVQSLEIGGIVLPEAAGMQAVLNGLRALDADDDALALAVAVVFDALRAAPGTPT